MEGMEDGILSSTIHEPSLIINGKFQMGFNGIWVGLKVEYTQDMAIFMGQMGDGMLNILLF